MTPVWPNLPSAETFLPVVALVVVVVPGLVALLYGGLTSQSAFWGRAGQEVLGGNFWQLREGRPPTTPLFPWSTALALSTGLGDPIWRLSLPSFVFWLGSAAAVYQLVRCWFDANSALLTCLLLAVNPVLLEQVQHGAPGPCVLFWSILGLWAYAEHDRGTRGYPWLWIAVGGVALGGLVLSVGPLAVWLPLLTFVHLFYEQIHLRKDGSPLLLQLARHPTLQAGLIVVAIALALSAPWIWMLMSTGAAPSFTGIDLWTPRLNVGEIVMAMPATIVLAGFGLLLSARMRIRRVGPERQSSMPVLWTLATMAMFAFVDPTASGLLLFSVPLTLMAVRALGLIVDRRLRDRVSYWLMLVTFWVFVLSRSPVLVSSAGSLVSSWLSSPESEIGLAAIRPDLGWRLFEIHLVFDAILVGSVVLAWLYGLSGRGDRYRRLLFGGFAATVVVVSMLLAAVRLVGPVRAVDPWRGFYDSIAKQGPYDWYAMVGPAESQNEVEFLARAASPTGQSLAVPNLQELDVAFERLTGRPLVIYFDTGRTAPASILLSRGTTTVKLDPIVKEPFAVVYAPDEKSLKGSPKESREGS